MEDKKIPFLDTIYHLRTIEQVILYNKIMKISETEEKETLAFLETEYEKEILDYPFVAPVFNPKAAMWASKMVYCSAQLLLYREHKLSDLDVFLPDFSGVLDASAMLSADLCLRFLPQIANEINRIDVEDTVLPILKKHLHSFHYSAVGFDLEIEKLNLDIVFSNNCLKQLYLNRIVERKAIKFAILPTINQSLMANFGDYKKEFWKEM